MLSLFRILGLPVLVALLLQSIVIPAIAQSAHRASIEDDEWTLSLAGHHAEGQFGAALSRGDFNDDGIDDLVVGSPFSSTGLSEWNGSAGIIFGRKTLTARSDLTSFEFDIAFYGARSGDLLGSSFAAGDFNHDGIDDLAIGAYNAADGIQRSGKIYVIYGKKTWERSSYDFSAVAADVEFVGMADTDQFGLSLASFDVNKDGVSDLLAGAPGAQNDAGVKSGVVYVYYGNYKGFATPLYKMAQRAASVTLYGHMANERFGSVVAGGLMSTGIYPDIVVGAYKASTETLKEAGRVYIYSGVSKLPPAVTRATSYIEGSVAEGWFGFSLDIADINGDRRGDLIISGFPYATANKTGRIMVYLGGNRFSHHGSSYSEEDTLFFKIEGAMPHLYPGAQIKIGHFNDDALWDLAIGAPGLSGKRQGVSYILYGKDAWQELYTIQDHAMDTTISGAQEDDWFGYSMEALDMNGDGIDDLAIGARYADTDYGKQAGNVFVVLGRKGFIGRGQEASGDQGQVLARGEFIAQVIGRFGLLHKKADFLAHCEQYQEFCLFNFLAMSDFDEVILGKKPLLYPDVPLAHRYYEDIVAGTMLGLINGFMGEEGSPFRPEGDVSRIQALKIILAAADLVPHKYRFELVAMLGSPEKLSTQPSSFSDVNAAIPHMWWYPRYTNFAVLHGIIPSSSFFRPDEPITFAEAEELIRSTLEYLETVQ